MRISRAWMRSTLAIGMPNASACTIAVMKPAEVADVGAVGQRAHGVRPTGTELHLLQHAEELLGQRALRVARDLRQRGVEAEPGLH